MRRVSAFLRRHLPRILSALVLLALVVVVWIFWTPIAQWLRSAWAFDAVAFFREHLLVVGIVGGCLSVLALIGIPKWQASRVQDLKDRLTVENAARQTLAQIVGGAVLIAGLFFTWANLKITQETATKHQEMAREGQITDRFTKAIAQLGEQGPEKLAVRLGGIYALERIARDSERDHWPIMEILTAYVREHAPRTGYVREYVPWSSWSSKPSNKGDLAAAQGQPSPKLATDIQAVLTVLGRRDRTYEKEDQRFDLSGTDLHNVYLGRAHLERAFLVGARLQGANLSQAHLQGAWLMEAHLQGVNLQHAQLKGAHLAQAHLQGAHLGDADLKRANLRGAHLEGANLNGAQLQGADLDRAQLEGADFRYADLQGARGLTVKQLCTAYTLHEAQLDPPLAEQIQQQCPKLLEKPPLLRKRQQ